jgi:FkbM family methyltransferase
MTLQRKSDGSLTLLGRIGRSIGLGRLLYSAYHRPRMVFSRRRMPDTEVEVPLFGMRFHMPAPRQFDCFREIYLHGVWEPEMTRAVREIVRPGMNVALVGADVGYYVLQVASLNPTGAIFAIEPFPAHFRILEKNVRDNDLTGVRLLNIAAGSADGTARLVNPGTESRLDRSDAAGGVEVPVRRLDDVLAPELTAGRKLDVVQIDVEGAELDVLKGMETLIARDRPTLLIELHGPYLPNFGASKTEVLQWLADRGYQARWLAMEALQDPGFSHAVFTPGGRS